MNKHNFISRSSNSINPKIKLNISFRYTDTQNQNVFEIMIIACDYYWIAHSQTAAVPSIDLPNLPET